MNRSVIPRRATSLGSVRASGRAIVAAAIFVLALAACSGDNEPGIGATSPVTTHAPGTVTPETETTPHLLTREEAEASARSAVEDYLALFAEVSSDPDRDVSNLEHVAAGRALDWATHQITAWRDAGTTGVGAQIVSDLVVTAVVLDPDDHAELEYPSVELTGCVDVSDTDIVDQDGNSVVPPERLDRVLVDYTVWNTGWPDRQQWRVVADDAQLTDTDPPEFVPCP